MMVLFSQFKSKSKHLWDDKSSCLSSLSELQVLDSNEIMIFLFIFFYFSISMIFFEFYSKFYWSINIPERNRVHHNSIMNRSLILGVLMIACSEMEERLKIKWPSPHRTLRIVLRNQIPKYDYNEHHQGRD